MNRNPLYLLDRIRNLNVSLIEDMSSDAMAMITDSFDESFVRDVLFVGKTNREQRKIIRCIKDNYKYWKKETDMFWGTLGNPERYPDFILELQMDIECGMIVTVKGSVPEPQSEPFVMPPVLGESLRRLKGLSETVADNNTPNLRAIIKEKGKRIEELEAEVEELKQNKEEGKNEEWVVELFSHFCYEDKQVAQKIINEMLDKTDPEIADIIFEKITQNQISPKTKNIDMWRVLHAAKIIESDSYQNLDTALRRRRKRKQ